MTKAIEVSQLTRNHGDLEAVRGIDFEVAAGETFGFLGPNGPGKSTTIKILCTLADPTTGSARVVSTYSGGMQRRLESPAACCTRRGLGKDRVQISTADDEAAIRALEEMSGLDAGVHDRLRAVTALVQPVPFLFVLGTGLSRLACADPHRPASPR